ncbi:tetratricopeptide repeat protein [Emticicia sp. CRIBPO]|uniref:tetratricopeptide repeat-containing sensor histidine kinase n=1 Tax=Emticicia sp. CRIBPO TaxID=2683258 RepID=UPI0014134348|nr:tetratricopeptide repeat protein [Emticicia sp. CRIBPO]NBA86120.1 tetratricopeptide repeat protein [Emticicia sp. CRIBPO]
MKKLIFLLLLSAGVSAQSLDTPAFNFDRKSDLKYTDSLLRSTRKRISELDALPPSPRRDTVRFELSSFLSYVYRSGTHKTDSTYHIAAQLRTMAAKKGNIKYQLRAVIFLEYYFRVMKKDYVEAMKLNFEAQKLMTGSREEEERNLWRINNNLGKLTAVMKKFRESVGYYTKALETFALDKRAVPAQLAEIYQSAGLSYNQNGEFEKSLSSYKQALQIIKDNRGSNTNFAYLYVDVAMAEKELGHYKEALNSLNLSLQYWEKLKSKPGISTVYCEMARIYNHLDDYHESIRLADQALTLSEGLPVVRLKSYEVLAADYEALKRFDEALKYHKLFMTESEAERKASKTSEMLALQVEAEKEKLEIRLLQEKEIQEQKYITLQKQEEINRIRGLSERQNLLKTIQNNELRSLLNIQTLTAASQKKQTLQENTIKQLKINELKHQLASQAKNRNFLFSGLVFISLSGLVLVWLNYKLRHKNKQLSQKNAEVEAALEKGRTSERKRVATELHDNVNSILASVKMSLQVIQPQTVHENKVYENVIKMVDNATREVRQISHNMMPAELEKEGFDHALQGLVTRLNLGETTRFELSLNGFKNNFSSEITFNLYMICLELCQNIQKHTEAAKANIDFNCTDRQLIMSVSDNGKGFEKGNMSEGMGLKNIRHRAKSIGADLRIQSQQGEGTVVFVRLPLNQSNHA